MAGVVAMASIIEDFDTQPCKKSRKDGDSPVVKTITNYFSPMPKPVEKPFSPPRTNNIMDYFSRKAPSSKEKSSSPEQSKENCQTQLPEKDTGPAAVKQPPQKRNKKTSKAARKLVEAETVSSTEDIAEEPHDNRDSTAKVIGSCGVLGSDTAALLAQLSAEACMTTGKSETNGAKTFSPDDNEDGFKCGNNFKPKTELNIIELSPIAPSKDKEKTVKTVTRNSRKKQQQEAKHSEPQEKEIESSLCDASMEVNVDEASQLNSSTVTISFEEFVRSQSQDRREEDTDDNQGKEDEIKKTTESEEMDTRQLDIPKAEESGGTGEPPLRVSPRTVTILAEVHAVSPKQEAKTVSQGKLASIFNKRKGSKSPAEVESSPHIESGHQFFPNSLTVKRKSNVVLQEEDLELAVLESESTPKCSEAERKQFMAAFKQPNLDGSKTKPAKSQAKQKQHGEKVSDDADNIVEENTEISPFTEQVPAAPQEIKAAKKKPGRKGKKKAKTEEEAVISQPAAAPVKDIEASMVEVDDKTEETSITSTPSVPALRRSRREAVVRQTPEAAATPTTPIRKTRKQNKSKDAAKNSPAEMSTPKIRKSKHGFFVAEIVSPPDAKQSPISLSSDINWTKGLSVTRCGTVQQHHNPFYNRIKLTRIRKKISTSEAESSSRINTSLSLKTSNESKKRKQAKKLVEKAKVIQKNKKAAVEEGSTLRRSSRAEAFSRKRYCEDEDSVICLEEEQTATPPSSKTQNSLRSLNDVLGKSVFGGKDIKTSGCKVTSLYQEKTARKVSTVISIFDDSSREGSENSQDDEQFRARRQFLKSGLPESFRKQIAKTAATKEAYSLSCSSFQPVIHMKQPPNNCPLWSLLWPESSLLRHLKELWYQTSNPFPCVRGSLCMKTEPACRASYERGSGWRPEISESVRQLLTAEVSTSNPAFPVQMFITRFLKRRTDHQQQCTASEPEAVTGVTSTTLPAEPAGGKRKRVEDEGEITVKIAKKQRGNSSEEKVSPAEPEPTKRGGRTRRARRSRPEEEVNGRAKPSVNAAPIPSEDNSVVVLDDLLLQGDTAKKDVVREEVLWTDKYQPQQSSDIIGNSVSVRRLYSWLKEWKLRADREESKKQKDKKQAEGSNDSDWDCLEDDSQDGEDMLCNTLLITGPTGVGKTAAVYACAQELGFKVFEVNASSQRSGRLILSQLKEATQSHQVDSQGVNAHKPTFFNSYGTSSSAGTLRPGSSPRKVNSPRRVVSSPRKHPQSPRGVKRGNLAPTSLANFFKVGRPADKETLNTKKNEQEAASKKTIKANESANKPKEPAVKSPAATSSKEKTSEEQSKKTATSLILFEEVDVIFDDDSGFLAAIKTFMTTTKRPVILTTSDPAFSTMFDGNFEEIQFKTPSMVDIGSFLRLVCLAEDMRTDVGDISSLLSLNGCDIRQSLLQLQFWTRSGGGHNVARPLTQAGKNENVSKKTNEEADSMSVCAVTEPSALPPCDTGCTESTVGLLNIEPKREIWELLRSQDDKVLCWELLTNSRRQGVSLLYSNMETLLPLPLTQLTTSTCKLEPSVSVSQDHPSGDPTELPSTVLHDALPSHARLLQTMEEQSVDCLDDGSPVKMSKRMKEMKRRQRLPDQDGLLSDSDSEDCFLSLCKPQDATKTKEQVRESLVTEVKRKPPTPEERLKSVPVSRCLESIADFLDNMSYMDSSLLAHPERGDNHRRTWMVGVVVKDGMTDESRLERDRGSWVGEERALDIQAVVEALSFHKCRVSVAEAWGKAQQLEVELGKEPAAELTLPVAAHRDGYSLTQDGPCQPQLFQRRTEVMESLMSKGVFGTLGSKPAAALDYLPTLRTICRSEQLKEQGKVKRRFLHYLDAIHLGLEKSTLQHLAKDFP